MSEPVYKVLIAKPGLDGHDRGARTITLALRDAGMEVIYTGLHVTPEMIVNAALQENVDAIGLSILSGAHMSIFPKVKAYMEEKGLSGVLLFGGGVIPPEDVRALKDMGVDDIFPPGSDIQHIIGLLKEKLGQRKQ